MNLKKTLNEQTAGLTPVKAVDIDELNLNGRYLLSRSDSAEAELFSGSGKSIIGYFKKILAEDWQEYHEDEPDKFPTFIVYLKYWWYDIMGDSDEYYQIFEL
jgi:hypothetical protein